MMRGTGITKGANVMLWEKSVVMERERPKVSTLLVKGVKPLHIKDFVNEVGTALDSGGSDRTLTGTSKQMPCLVI